MNRSKLKTYAIQARRAFIQAVTDRAALFGLTAKKTEPITEQGDVAIIAGKPFPRSVAGKRRRLEERIERHGFEQAMEAMAYTWFNRLVAIRFMELRGYLDHGYRVLSHPDPNSAAPEILEHAEHVTLPGLKAEEIIELKLDGNKEAELYRKLLIAQCNALNRAMPFLFERIDDETELLLPDNLLHSDSILRKLVAETDEEDWQQVEIIGWLYQFYISEKKDQVIGKVVKSEDIPAATQLFTPNWIVKYLVQNSLGRQWVATYPHSPLKGKMEYYIEPAEQAPEVQAQLDAITPETLNPEELTLLDPACGSGHILVEAYDLLKDIYLERGYRLRDIPGLILTRNLFGLEIDDRAAQLAALAVMMKARADDRRIFDGQHQLNVLAIQESNGLDINTIVQAFTAKQVTDESFIAPGEFGFMAPIKIPLLAGEAEPAPAGDDQIAAGLKSLLHLFENAKTYGSLITVPEGLAKCLPALAAAVEKAMASGNLAVEAAARVARTFVLQAAILAGQYSVVSTNPPYMGARSGMNASLKAHTKTRYKNTKADMYAMFIDRARMATKPLGFTSMVTMHGWMFLTSYEQMRADLLRSGLLHTLAHLGPRAFGTISGEVVQVAAFSIQATAIPSLKPVFLDLVEGDEAQKASRLRAKENTFSAMTHTDFRDIPGQPIAYWATEGTRRAFKTSDRLPKIAESKQGMATSDNERFLRCWHEVAFGNICFGCKSDQESESRPEKWYPYNKGGSFRRWYGNNDYVVNWQHNGHELRQFVDRINKLHPGGRLKNQEYYYRECVTYSALSSGLFGCRHNPPGFLFDTKGSCVFSKENNIKWLLGYLNSNVAQEFLNILCPTLDYSSVGINRLPISDDREADRAIDALMSMARADWDSCEESWDFSRPRLMQCGESDRVKDAYGQWAIVSQKRIAIAEALQTANNERMIRAFGLVQELSPDVEEEHVTLCRADRFDDIVQLVSYSIGCVMGRYSLDEPGLIYAHSGNEGFDPRRYKTFPADEDGIVPITEIDWFEDDAARRFEEFIAVAWPKEHLEENLAFVAESLGAKKGKQPRDTIRRYFAKSFFKDHLKTYKKRPIYWLFSSGKLGAFQCLVYLHRYNEGTLARMRTEYVIPLQGKIAARVEQIGGRDGEGGDIASATSAAHKRNLRKEHELLRRHQVELASFDEKLRHYADQRIKLDLDDGVKVNYGKFGDLLAEVSAVCGRKKDED